MTVLAAHTHLQPPLKGKRSQRYVDYEYHHPNELAEIAAIGLTGARGGGPQGPEGVDTNVS